MSWQQKLLNSALKLIEKRHMANTKGPESLRKAFELKAKIFFHAPRGTEMEWFDVGGTSALRIGGDAFDPERVILYIHGVWQPENAFRDVGAIGETGRV